MKKTAIFIGLLFLSTQLLWASPSGLNNIPTTDVAPDKTLVLQSWLTVGKDAGPVYVTGAKYGIIDKIEIGLDSKVGADEAGPVALQGKFKIFEADFGFAALAGVEGITLEGDIVDDIVPYFALSQKFKLEEVELFRVNGGYSFQKNNFSLFAGIDRTFPVFDQELVLRSDMKQVNDRDDLLASVGFLLTLPFNLVLESWLSIPTEDGAENSVTVKLNYVMTF